VWILIAVVLNTDGTLEGLMYNDLFPTPELCEKIGIESASELDRPVLYHGCFEIPKPNV